MQQLSKHQLFFILSRRRWSVQHSSSDDSVLLFILSCNNAILCPSVTGCGEEVMGRGDGGGRGRGERNTVEDLSASLVLGPCEVIAAWIVPIFITITGVYLGIGSQRCHKDFHISVIGNFFFFHLFFIRIFFLHWRRQLVVMVEDRKQGIHSLLFLPRVWFKMES